LRDFCILHSVKMHILYLHQYFATRNGSTGTRSYEFARHLVGKGHRVTMLTSGLGNREFAVPEGKPYAEFETEGIGVVAIAAAYSDPHIGTGLSGWRRSRCAISGPMRWSTLERCRILWSFGGSTEWQRRYTPGRTISSRCHPA